MKNNEIEIDGVRFYALHGRPYLHFKPVGLLANIDILITHGAAKGILDENGEDCPLLRELIEEMNSKVHIFWYFHKNCGTKTIDNTIYSNMAISQ